MNFKLKAFLVVMGIPFLMAPVSWAKEPEQTAIPIKVQVVQNREFTGQLQEVGKIIPVDSTALTFSASDKLKSKYFKDGAYVKKGDLIAELDNTQAKGELDKAETQYAIDQSKLTRMLALVKKQPDSISKQDIENQKLQTNLARVDVEQKKADMQNYQLIAPFDGRLTSFNYSIGSRLDSSDVVVSIIKADPIEVNYSIGQKELGEAKMNQKVTVQVDAYKDKTFTGYVDYIAPQVDNQSGRIEVHASIKNTDKLLVPGMFANVTQYSSEKVTYPIVSQNAVVVNGDQRYVWLYTGNGVKQQTVTLGENTNDGYVVIKQGIQANDKVVVAGQQNLKPGSLVKVQGFVKYQNSDKNNSGSTASSTSKESADTAPQTPVASSTPESKGDAKATSSTAPANDKSNSVEQTKPTGTETTPQTKQSAKAQPPKVSAVSNKVITEVSTQPTKNNSVNKTDAKVVKISQKTAQPAKAKKDVNNEAA